jgi:myo-inositol catabolism protein IolS
MIERRSYGNNQANLPVIGVGCWAFGGGSGDYWGAQDQKDVDAVVAAALDQGANYFDTAEAYNDGRSEEALGIALKGRRQAAIIGSKVQPNNTEPAVLRQHCEASLRRLGTDVIDIYMLHWPLTDHSLPDALATLEDLQKEGKIGTIGLSNFGVHQVQEVLQTGAPIGTNQLCYNLLSRAIEAELVPLCAHASIGIVAYMPLQQGLLTGKFRSADETPAARTRTRHFRGDRPGSRHGEAGAEAETFSALQGIREIAAELQVPMAQLALAWMLSRPAITCVLAGIRTTEQLAENIAGARLKLSPEVIQRLDLLTEPLRKKLGNSPDYFQASNSGRSW